MENNKKLTMKIYDDILLETLEKMMDSGIPIGNFTSHYALMVACTKIVWGSEHKYQDGVIYLNAEQFISETMSQRIKILNNYLTNSMTDLLCSQKRN